MASQNQDKKNKPSIRKNYRHTTCVSRVQKVCKHNAYVKFMLDAMKSSGCEVDLENQILCEPCDDNSTMSGGFDPDAKQIVICENKATSLRVVSRLLTHELIHAFDHCRVDINWHNLNHIACSEIRASSLSGECSFLSENLYGKGFGIRGHHQDCVRKHATESMMCSRGLTKEVASKHVDQVWSRCFKDYSPFPRIPRKLSDLKNTLNNQTQDHITDS
ncbi:putative mitochondrial inner membrane protease ATP23-like [Apostichopus japonicus]|uniref:Mitochondrial inner membrane protease ATP23 n=1 Tax=Stichopus japonicus TaxID=307972 RepID=A0A2G8K7A6_STIJA|nr:putative mitochondrial inner membrane protease ATP23-like [Apostichopus japonicus]